MRLQFFHNIFLKNFFRERLHVFQNNFFFKSFVNKNVDFGNYFPMKNMAINIWEMIGEMIADHDRDRRSQDFEKVIVK